VDYVFSYEKIFLRRIFMKQEFLNDVDCLINRKTVLQMITISKTQWCRLETSGKFPTAIQIGAARVAYFLNEVEAWIEEKKSTSRVRNTRESGGSQ
jgi:predicted DNA-binding transcriptional regulator AlpA